MQAAPRTGVRVKWVFTGDSQDADAFHAYTLHGAHRCIHLSHPIGNPTPGVERFRSFPCLLSQTPSILWAAQQRDDGFSKPVIATHVGGLSEVVKNGETGLLVPPRDPAALAEALTTLLANPDMAQRLGRQARELSATYHSWDRIAQRLGQVYERSRHSSARSHNRPAHV